MSYLGRSPAVGTQRMLDSIESQFNGVLTTFDLRYGGVPTYPTLSSSLIVSLGGVLQEPGEAYYVSSDKIVFSEAPSAGTECWILLYSQYGTGVGAAQNGTLGAETLVLTGELHGPANFIIDPAAVGDDTGTVEIKGNLTVQGTTTTINSTTVDLDHISLGDNEIANFGDGDDLKIYHNGAASLIQDTGTGPLYIEGSDIYFKQYGGSTNYISLLSNGNVGIGTTNPSKKLTVNGDVLVTDENKIFLNSNADLAINTRKTFGNPTYNYVWTLSYDGLPAPYTITQSSNDYSDFQNTNLALTYVSGTQPSGTVYAYVRITSNTIDILAIRQTSSFDYDDTTVFEISTSTIGSGTQNLQFKILNSVFTRPVTQFLSVGGDTEPADYSYTPNLLKIGNDNFTNLSDVTSLTGVVSVGHNSFNGTLPSAINSNAVGNFCFQNARTVNYSVGLGTLIGGSGQTYSSSVGIGYQFSMQRNANWDIGIGHETVGESAPRGTAELTYTITAQPTSMPADGTYTSVFFNDKLGTKSYRYNLTIVVSGGAITSTSLGFAFTPKDLPAVNDVMSTTNGSFAGMELTVNSVSEIGGGYNVGVGGYTLRFIDGASGNTAIGHAALNNIGTGSYNTALGYLAGSSITTGNYNVVIGSNNGSIIAESSNNIILSDGQGNIRQFIDGGGNVGIGTTNPQAKLDVAGNVQPSADATHDLGSPSFRWANIYSADLQLSNEGSANEVDGTWGAYTIQEGEEELYLINRRSGKKFKFVLEEVK